VSPQVGPEFPEIEEYIMDELIPALKKRYRVAEEAIGVDGVSMGGARSMYYGLKYPEVFFSVGSVQGAFGPYLDLYRHLAKTNEPSLKKRAIQLVTSDRDVMKPSVEAMHKLLLENHIPHSYRILTGPHDYIFNQGPGAISLLVFHSQALRQGN
jgi:enterochelin esterase-like enzyme